MHHEWIFMRINLQNYFHVTFSSSPLIFTFSDIYLFVIRIYCTFFPFIRGKFVWHIIPNYDAVIRSFAETITRKIWNKHYARFRRNDQPSMSSMRVDETPGRLLHLALSWRCVQDKAPNWKWTLLLVTQKWFRASSDGPACTKRRRWLRNIGTGRYHSDCERFGDDGLIALSSTLEVHSTVSSLSRTLN